MAKLSILIPARQEEFLQRTLDDVFEKITGDTEVIVALDNWDDPPQLKPNDKLRVITTKAGQRGATNALARLSESKYVMKLDAHVCMSKGFDERMMEDMQNDTVIVPALANLHAYNWVCEKGHRNPQGKIEKCNQCEATEFRKEVVWQIVHKPLRSNFYFDTALHFQYSKDDVVGLVTETMSIQGSCFMANRDKYFELNLCDEAFGSWGQQGTEVACKTWLSGGRVLATKKAFYGHQFRVTEGFPYENPVPKILETQVYSRNLFLKNNWLLQKKPIQWLIEKFEYQGDWTKDKVKELCSDWKL